MSIAAKTAGATAAVLAVGFVVCAANPVMARELPIVGGIFAELQDKVSFFGNFADRAETLEEAETKEKASEVSETVDAKKPGTTEGAYTKTSVWSDNPFFGGIRRQPGNLSHNGSEK